VNESLTLIFVFIWSGLSHTAKSST